MSHFGFADPDRPQFDMNMSLDDVPVRDPGKSDGHSPYPGGPMSADDSSRSRRVFVSHIPFRYNWRDIRDEVKKITGFEVAYCELFLDEGTGKSKGCGMIEFASESHAKRAVDTLNGHIWDDMRLSAHEDRSNNYVRGMKSRVAHDSGRGLPRSRSPPHHSRQGHSSRRRSRSPLRTRHSDHGHSSHSHHSSQYDEQQLRHKRLSALEQLQQVNQLAALLTTSVAGSSGEPEFDDPRSDHIVHISNIDYSCTWQRLKDLLSEAGRVRRVHLRTDGEGKSRGVATAEFDSRRDAEKCIDVFNGHMMNGRALRLHMYREPDRDSMQGMPTQSLPSPPPNLGDLLAGIAGPSGNSAAPGNNPFNLLSTLTSLAALQQLTQSGSNAGVLAALGSLSKPSQPSDRSPLGGHSESSSRSRVSSSRHDSRDDAYRRRDDRPIREERRSMPSRDYHHGSDRPSSRSSTVDSGSHYHSGTGSATTGGNGRAAYPRVFARNLDWGLDDEDVMSIFKDAGDVVSVDILRDPDGRSKGRAIVTYHTMEECYRAIETLTGRFVRGRPVEVKHDTFS